MAKWMFSVRAFGNKKGGKNEVKEVDTEKASILRTFSKVRFLHSHEWDSPVGKRGEN